MTFIISSGLFHRMVDAVYATVEEVDGWLFAEINGTWYTAPATTAEPLLDEVPC